MATKPKTTTTDVAVQEKPAEDVKANVPATVTRPGAQLTGDLAAAYGTGPTGFENDTAADYVLPYITILQGLSPQCETVEGARPGIICNTTTNELIKDFIDVVVVRKEHKFVEWKPNRGGLVGAYHPDDPKVLNVLKKVGGAKLAALNLPDNNYQLTKALKDLGIDAFKLKTEAGNDLMETFYNYVVMAKDGMPTGFGCMAFSSTKNKKWKAWNTQARNNMGQWGLPVHALQYRFSPIKERNEKGEFYNWKSALTGDSKDTAIVMPGTPLFNAVAELKGSDAKIDYGSERKADGDEDESTDRLGRM